jgi:hypothetical protein
MIINLNKRLNPLNSRIYIVLSLDYCRGGLGQGRILGVAVGKHFLHLKNHIAFRIAPIFLQHVGT